MKQDRHVTEELSAYLDGEARAPGGIARHVAQCPACARRLEELRRLRETLAALPAPAPRPDFDVRVLAALEAAPAPRRWPVLLAPAAALAAMIIGMVFLYPRAPGPAPAPGEAAVTVDARWQDDEAVVVELAALAESGEDLSGLLFTGLTEESAAFEDEAAAFVLDFLAAAHAAEGPADPWEASGPWNGDAGFDSGDAAALVQWMETGDIGGEPS